MTVRLKSRVILPLRMIQEGGVCRELVRAEVSNGGRQILTVAAVRRKPLGTPVAVDRNGRPLYSAAAQRDTGTEEGELIIP